MNQTKQYDKLCPVCKARFDPSDEGFVIDALRHILDEHPGSKRLRDVVNGVEVRVACENCGERFVTGLNVFEGGLSRSGYCDDCCEEDPFRKLFAVEIGPEEAVEAQVSREEDRGEPDG